MPRFSKSEWIAIYILVLYTVAFIASLAVGYEIPVALNVAMPAAAGGLLGTNLFPSNKDKNGNGNRK